MRIIVFLCLFFVGQTTSLWAQKISDLSVEQLRADFDYLELALEKYNPAMYAYHPKATFKKKIDEIQASIKEPLGVIEFHKHLRLAVAAVNEGHMTVGVETDPFYKGFYDNEFKSLPLDLQFFEDRAYLWRNFSESDDLERGDEILFINGHSIAEIRALIFTYTCSDGDILPFKQMRLSTELFARYFWFVEQPDLFNIEYRKNGSEKTQELELKALTRTEMSKWIQTRAYKDKRPKGINKFYSLNTVGQTAHLTLRTFDEKIAKENDIEALSFYERIFKRLRQNKVKHLIIDVRDNIGGMKQFGDDLLPYILKKNRKGIYRELHSWDGKIVKSEFPKRSKWWFKGDLYILVNEGTFSTAAHIAKYSREFCDAITIGAETGSRYEGFAAGTFQYIKLPNTKITVGIPDKWVKNIISEKQKTSNRGLLPDYPVNVTIEDLLEGKDRMKEKALELIQLSSK